MTRVKALDLESRMAEMSARLEAAEKRAIDAEQRLSAAETAKPARSLAFGPIPHDSKYETGKARQPLPNGKDIILTKRRAANGKTYVRFDYDPRFFKGTDGKQKPTRGIDTEGSEFAWLLLWLAENPETVATWLEWAGDVSIPATAK